MKTRARVSIVTLVLLGLTACPAAGQNARTLIAQDNSFSVMIPADWNVLSAIMRVFAVRSPRNEDVRVLTLDIFSNPQSLANALAVCQRVPVAPGCPPLRLWSPPLGPVDVVRALYPRLTDDIQQMRILGAWPTAMAGKRGVIVRYQFMKHGVLMEGLEEIYLVPGLATAGMTYWSFVASGADGPREYFRRNLGLYAAILETLKYNQGSLDAAARAPFVIGAEMRKLNERFYQKWWPVLGGEARYPDSSAPSGQGTIPLDRLPPDAQSYDWYLCWPGNGPVYVPHGHPAPCPSGERIPAPR